MQTAVLVHSKGTLADVRKPFLAEVAPLILTQELSAGLFSWARMAKTCSPYLSTLAAPSPEILINSAGEAGRASATATSVASVKMQYAGTLWAAASWRRHSLSRVSVCSSKVDGQSMCRLSLRSAELCKGLPQERQCAASADPLGRPTRGVVVVANEAGSTGSRKRDGLRPLPPPLRVRDHEIRRCCRARVMPT